jgi:hypothetical protein
VSTASKKRKGADCDDDDDAALVSSSSKLRKKWKDDKLRQKEKTRITNWFGKAPKGTRPAPPKPRAPTKAKSTVGVFVNDPMGETTVPTVLSTISLEGASWSDTATWQVAANRLENKAMTRKMYKIRCAYKYLRACATADELSVLEKTPPDNMLDPGYSEHVKDLNAAVKSIAGKVYDSLQQSYLKKGLEWKYGGVTAQTMKFTRVNTCLEKFPESVDEQVAREREKNRPSKQKNRSNPP